MNMFVKGIDADTQILIAMGAAIAGNCKPCLEKIVALAKENKLDSIQMKGAVAIGQFVKDHPATQMKELADELLGSRLAENQMEVACACGPSDSTVSGCMAS